MSRHHGVDAIVQQRGLERARSGLALHHRLGLHHLESGALGNFDGNGPAFKGLQLHLHVFGQVGRAGRRPRPADRHLVEGFRLHEHITVAVLVEIIVVVVFDEGLFDTVGGAQAFHGLHPVADAAHFQMGNGRALAGMDILGGQDEIKLAVLLDDIAFAHRAGDNRNHGKPLKQRNLAGSLAGPQRQRGQAVESGTPRAHQKGPENALVGPAKPRRPPAPAAPERADKGAVCGAWFEARASPKWNAAPWRFRPAMRRICMPLRPA